ncbi:MAG: hypothetical protein II821_07710 [Treponema sp.]|nr:hypothetical protein [Treponema sp.]
MTDTILCIDIGTSSLKAALLPDNLSKAPVFVSRQYFSEEAISKNHVANEYLPSLSKALSELKQKNPDYAIEAICVSGNGPSVVSEDGTTLLYNQFFTDSSKNLTENITQNQKNALKDTKSLFIPKLFEFKNNFQSNWNSSEYIFGVPEFLLYQLTGKAVSILPEERFLPAYWTESELKSCGFSDSDIKKLPPFVKAGSYAGKVTENAALATGLLEGTFVFAGAPDFVAALIGTGTVLPGRLCDRAGTSEGLNLCTTQPVFADGLRTLPAVIPGLWNLSYLLEQTTEYTDVTDISDEKSNLCESETSAVHLEKLSHGIKLLREAAESSGEYFPNYMTITGGQAFNEELTSQKEAVTGLKIKKMPCNDAELIGDLILTRVSLGDYDDITEAVFAILGA